MCRTGGRSTSRARQPHMGARFETCGDDEGRSLWFGAALVEPVQANIRRAEPLLSLHPRARKPLAEPQFRQLGVEGYSGKNRRSARAHFLGQSWKSASECPRESTKGLHPQGWETTPGRVPGTSWPPAASGAADTCCNRLLFPAARGRSRAQEASKSAIAERGHERRTVVDGPIKS